PQSSRRGIPDRPTLATGIFSALAGRYDGLGRSRVHQLNFQFNPARTISSVSLTFLLSKVFLPTTTGGLTKRPVPKSACKYSIFKVAVPAGSIQTAHSPPTP